MAVSARPLALVGVALLLAAAPDAARAETYRSTVVVERPAGMARRLADLEVDAAARTALVEAFIADRLAEPLMTLRGARVRTALEPVARLIERFAVVSKQDLDASRVRVTCEGDIDTAAIVLQLVSHRILTFGDDPPRVLLVAAPGTRPADMQAMRGRIAETVGAAGIRMVAAEAGVSAGRPASDAAAAAAVAAGADFVAMVAYAGARAPSPVGGVVMDGTVQYTVIRPHDATIVAEQVFNARGSGTSEELAARMIMDSLAPGIARSLAGGIVAAIFANGSVIDPDRQAAPIRVNVYARPNAAATNALIGILRDDGVGVSLGTGTAAREAGSSRQPADQLIVAGDVTIERLYDVFATAKFGDRRTLRASVFEYGDDHIGLEILDNTTPTVAPLPRPRPVAIGVGASLPGPLPAGSASAAGQAGGGRGAPSPIPSSAEAARSIGAGNGAAEAGPLQFRLSAAFSARARGR